MRKAQFKLEFLGNSTFDGFTEDETWNGWACPYFTYEESVKILKVQNASGGKATYEPDSDRFIFCIQDEEDVFEPIEVGDLKLYPIGNGIWIWDEVTDASELATNAS